ncbi:MAG TPA: hypothetical protein VE994_15310 [Terriglobales bacterium]|nr:hypothetical protein [Terriglobales bacterium]
MIQRGQDFSLTLESADTDGVAAEFVRKNFDGDVAFQFRIAGAVHLAEAPSTQ